MHNKIIYLACVCCFVSHILASTFPYIVQASTFPYIVQETFGAMAKTEKIAFILEQVRLCLDRKDYVR